MATKVTKAVLVLVTDEERAEHALAVERRRRRLERRAALSKS